MPSDYDGDGDDAGRDSRRDDDGAGGAYSSNDGDDDDSDSDLDGPYFHVETGKILTYREARAIFLAEKEAEGGAYGVFRRRESNRPRHGGGENNDDGKSDDDRNRHRNSLLIAAGRFSERSFGKANVTIERSGTNFEQTSSLNSHRGDGNRNLGGDGDRSDAVSGNSKADGSSVAAVPTKDKQNETERDDDDGFDDEIHRVNSGPTQSSIDRALQLDPHASMRLQNKSNRLELCSSPVGGKKLAVLPSLLLGAAADRGDYGDDDNNTGGSRNNSRHGSGGSNHGMIKSSSKPSDRRRSSNDGDPNSDIKGSAAARDGDTGKGETDPDVLRAKAMALAVRNEKKLTPEQMVLIAAPDVQQQKLIEEARVRNTRTQQQQQPLMQLGTDLQHFGTEIKRFIEAEKEKPPAQWGADLGKFIEDKTKLHPSSIQKTAEGGEGGGQREQQPHPPKKKMVGFGTDPTRQLVPPPEFGKDNQKSSLLDNVLPGLPSLPKKASSSCNAGLTPSANPTAPPLTSATPPVPARVSPTTPGKTPLWSHITPLSKLDGATNIMSKMLPGKPGPSESLPGGDDSEKISGVLWKRRSRMGKHSSKAWEKRRVALRGTKLVYYKTFREEGGGEEEEDDEEDFDGAATRDVSDADGSSAADSADASSSPPTATVGPAVPPALLGGLRLSRPSIPRPLGLSFIEQAAHAAEQKIQSARDEISRIAQTAAGALDSKNSDPTIPRGILDVSKEKATVGASMGHSGSPTPFCISVKVRGETRWKFCFESHANQMEWLVALTDVVIRTSVDTYGANEVGAFEMERYTIRWPRGGANCDGAVSAATATKDVAAADDTGVEEGIDAAATTKRAGERRMEEMPFSYSTVSTSDDGCVYGKKSVDNASLLQKKIPKNLAFLAMVLASAALTFARSSSTTIDQFWMLVVFANFGIWRAYSRFAAEVESSSSLSSSNLRRSQAAATSAKEYSRVVAVETASGRRSSAALVAVHQRDAPEETVAASAQTATFPESEASTTKPTAGTSTIQVVNVDDPSANKGGVQFPSWRSISSDCLNVRSHGYLSTKKKVPSPGELYECFATDCFSSQQRYLDIVTRVTLPESKFDDHGGSGMNTWQSPDIFVVTVSIPTEAPKLGRSTDDGPGTTVVAYFRMKEMTRRVLRRITAPGYDPNSDDGNVNTEPDAHILNAVHLFEEWCQRAPNDPTFQARFKLIPQANLTEMGSPSYIAKYNGKPVLIKRNQVTGFLTNHPSLNAMEFDVSLHPFPFIFKQAMSYMKEHYFEKVVATLGFVIEGRCDNELPEVAIGATQVCYPSPKYVVTGEEFFAGTSPKPDD